MRLETKNKQINLVLRTRKIVTICNILQDKNFENAFIKSYNETDIDALSKIIFTFAEDDEGQKPFNASTDVFDFLDDLRTENKMNYTDVYKKIAEALNEEGFFRKKMTKKELEDITSDPLSGIDMSEIVKKSAEKAMSNIAEKEFQGYRA